MIEDTLHLRAGWLTVSPDLLIKVLGLPPNTHLMDVQTAQDRPVIRFLVAHPTLRPVPEGEFPPELNFIHRTIEGHFREE